MIIFINYKTVNKLYTIVPVSIFYDLTLKKKLQTIRKFVIEPYFAGMK